jgi:hypothetical protein
MAYSMQVNTFNEYLHIFGIRKKKAIYDNYPLFNQKLFNVQSKMKKNVIQKGIENISNTQC